MGSEETLLLLAEDDDDNYLLAANAIRAAGIVEPVHRVRDGEELLEFLERQTAPRRLLILLDLNMPRKDGRQALIEIRADPRWKRIPVLILTGSSSEVEAAQAYRAGANSFISKPNDWEGLVRTMAVVKAYWLHLAAMPLSAAEEDRA